MDADLNDVVRAVDPERWLATRYARREVRPALTALFALDVTLGRVVASTTEPMIGAMRLAWWREALEKLHLPPVPSEPVLEALAAAVVRGDADVAAELALMTDGWLALIEAEELDDAALRDHGRERGARLFGLAARVLGGDAGAVGQMGQGWALADLARHVSQQGAADRARAMAAMALRQRPRLARRLRPLGALAALARRDAACAGNPRQGAPGRQVRMLMALITRR